jgi:hypothetical protein
MVGELGLSGREVKRAGVLEELACGRLRQQRASELLGVSPPVFVNIVVGFFMRQLRRFLVVPPWMYWG